MRIISQGGNADLPYEEIALCMACEDIVARHNDKEYLMARYSTMKKAENAMEMLHKSYIGMPVVAVKDVEMDVKMIADSIRNGFIQPMTLNEPKVECDIFQFPQDEDVEV